MIDLTTILTSEDCENILREYYSSASSKLIEYKVAPLSNEVEGFLGEHFILTIHSEHKNENQVLSFFVKTEPIKLKIQVKFCNQCGAFPNERFFYQVMIPEYKKYCTNFDESIVPKCYYWKNNTVVLENLSVENYVLAPTIDIMDLHHIKLVLKVFAKLHSASITYEEKKSAELKKPFHLMDAYGEYLTETFFRRDEKHLGYRWHHAGLKCVHAIIDLMPEDGGIPRDQFKREFQKLAENCCEYSAPSTRFRNVCCHADLWRKNVLFKYENNTPVKCRIVDFQLIKYNPPVYDILKFLHQVTTAEMRKHLLADFLQFYYNSLTSELKLEGLAANKLLPYDEFLASYKYVVPYVKVEGLYYYTFQKIGLEDMKELMQDTQKYIKFSFEDRSYVAGEFYKEGSYFKKWIDDILLEIKDIIMNGEVPDKTQH